MSKRLNLMVTDEAYEKLSRVADSPRKMGQKISELILAAYEESLTPTDAIDTETLRLQLLGLSGEVRQLAGRLMKLETQLAAVIADRQP
jgi:hypothetical protein